jgi:hypothetical protein
MAVSFGTGETAGDFSFLHNLKVKDFWRIMEEMNLGVAAWSFCR